MMQMTFGETVGLDPVVPCRAHPDDVVECSDGSTLQRRFVFFDCQDNPHATEEDCFDANVAIVEEILSEIDRWVTHYTTECEDYAGNYDFVVDDADWFDPIKDWIQDNYGDYYGHTRFDGIMDELVGYVCEDLYDSSVTELEYTSSNYAAYNGPGCCLYTLDIDEYEEHTDILGIPELHRLHDTGILDDIIDHVNCDAYVYRTRRREVNPETGKFEYVGRETYDMWNSEYPTITTYHSPGGLWYFVVPADRMREAVAVAIGQWCQQHDRRA